MCAWWLWVGVEGSEGSAESGSGDGDISSDDGGSGPSDSAVFKPIPIVPRAYSLADVRRLVDECPDSDLLPSRLGSFIHRGVAISTSAQEVLERPASAEEL